MAPNILARDWLQLARQHRNMGVHDALETLYP
jgi:hypothetical protein